MPEALTFRTGANEWVQHDAWPPKRDVADASSICRRTASSRSIRRRRAPRRHSTATSRIPANPVPYRPRPIRLEIGLVDVAGRGSALRPPAARRARLGERAAREDVTISGKIVANLFASTAGTDSDWIVKLIDVYPEKYAADPEMGGYQLMIAGDVFRGRYRRASRSPSR